MSLSFRDILFVLKKNKKRKFLEKLNDIILNQWFGYIVIGSDSNNWFNFIVLYGINKDIKISNEILLF